MFNEVLLLQIFMFMFIFLFLFSTNLLVLWYITGFILIFLGLFLLYDSYDIFIGFLWLIDLGVGLVFLVFILHFTNFLYKKINFKINIKTFIYGITLILLILMSMGSAIFTKISYNDLFTIYPFLISWYDYYILISHPFKSDLNILREVYYFNNSFEFLLINFFLLYGINLAISFFFLIKFIFLRLNFFNFKILNKYLLKTNYLFIRSQNLLNQQDEGASVKTLIKKNYDPKKNFFKNFR